MPPFKYEAFVNPYIGSISELMGKGDQAKAEALLRIGEIQARAAEQRGQAWGNAVQGVGNIVSKAITDYNDPKLRMQKIELAKAEEADRLRQASTGLSSQTIPSTISTNVPGVPFEGATVNVVPNERGIGSRVFGAADFGAGILPSKPQSVFGSVDIGKTMVEPDSTVVQSAGPNVSRFVDQSTQMLKVKDFQNALSGLVDPKTGKGFSLESIASRLKPLIDINESLIDYDAKKSAFDKSQQVGFGTLANSILTYVDQNPGSRITDIASVAAAAWGDRLGSDKIAAFMQDLQTLSTSQQRAKLEGLKSTAEAQMPMKVLGENSREVGAFGTEMGRGFIKPLPERSAALQLMDKAQADFDFGIKNGSIPAGTNFTEWSKKTTPAVPASIQEYKFAVEQGYKGTYNEYQTMDANRRRSLTVNNAATDDAMIVQAAQSIVNNPRDLTSPRTISSLRGDQRMKLFNEIKRISPDFNVGNIERQIKFLDSYENPAGRAAINRSSMNNILMHSADLSAVNQTYRRSNLRLVNTAISEIAKQGGTTWSQFMTPLQVLKDEIALYFAGGYAPKGQQQAAWEAIVNDKATPSQVEQFAKDIIHVGLRRADTANEQFKTMMGYDDPNLITPEAVRAAQQLGLGKEVKKYGSGGQIGARGNAAPGTSQVVGKYKVVVN
jgi:hypothetical protein